MKNLINRLKTDFPNLKFRSGTRYAWSPTEQIIWYETADADIVRGSLALVHELAHAILGHNKFRSDLELLKYEVRAWKQARILADTYELSLDEEYIDDCLESYREWLYRRSMCVECDNNSLQDSLGHYNCHICGAKWSVPRSQLCKIQRRKVTTKHAVRD